MGATGNRGQSKNKNKNNPNVGKKHLHPWDDRRSTNYAHSNLLRMGHKNYKAVTVTIDPSRAGTARKAYDEFIGSDCPAELKVFG